MRVLKHTIYFVFFSISIGMPTSIAALIVTLQPILTNILSGPILNEKVTFKQWIGVLLGFFGATLVLGLDLGSKIPLMGLIATIIALISITASILEANKIDTEGEIGEESLRVNFVAFTRAREKLFIIADEKNAKTFHHEKLSEIEVDALEEEEISTSTISICRF